MIRVLMAAPYKTGARFRGGIAYVAESISHQEAYLEQKGMIVEAFDTCRVERTSQSAGKLRLENFINFVRICRDLPRSIHESGCDVLYYHSSTRLALLKDLLALIRAKSICRLPTILHIHFAGYRNILFGNRCIDRLMILLLNRYIDRIIFLSRNTADEFVNHGLMKGKACIVYNFHTSDFNRTDIDKKLQSSICKETVDLLFLASIDRRKGIIDALRALREVKGSFVFHICGVLNDDTIELEFSERVDQLGARIVLHGFVSGPEKDSILLKSDILVLPSYSEGLPISIIEAMAAGCSIITTDVGAISEIITSGNGYVIEPGDLSQLICALTELIANGALRVQQMRQNFDYSHRFSVKGFIDELSQICNGIR